MNIQLSSWMVVGEAGIFIVDTKVVRLELVLVARSEMDESQQDGTRILETLRTKDKKKLAPLK